MKPGLYEGLTFDEYLKIDAINKSSLDYFLRSPKHFWAHVIDPNREAKEPTPAMRLGSAIHCAILEPAEFQSRYAIAPDVDRRTKEGKEAWAKFISDSQGREVISEVDLEIVGNIASSVKSNQAAATLLEDGDAESVLVWEDQIEGVLCKARLDWFNLEGGYILDIKSTEDARASQFARQVANLNWHLQAAFYLSGARALFGDDFQFIFGALEKSRPYACAFYFADDDMIITGRKMMRQLLAQYAKCRQENKWPGYAEEIQTLKLPKYALTEAQATAIEEF